MHGKLKYEDEEAAREDLQNRTLSKISGDFARLVYLASTRDYNTGEYRHEGLARQFSERAARNALASCHRELFERLVQCSVRELVERLEAYARSAHLPCSDLVRAWEKLEPYRVTLPLDCGPLAAKVFASNVRTALAVLDFRQARHPQDPQFASPRQ
jgi:hypothetical protein